MDYKSKTWNSLSKDFAGVFDITGIKIQNTNWHKQTTQKIELKFKATLSAKSVDIILQVKFYFYIFKVIIIQ